MNEPRSRPLDGLGLFSCQSVKLVLPGVALSKYPWRKARQLNFGVCHVCYIGNGWKYNDAMKMPERIETERLVLRKPRMDDTPAIFTGWAQDAEMTRYLTWRPHQGIEQTEEFVQGCIRAWEEETRFPYVITLKENSEVIGMIDPRIEGSKVGIGYGAARSHWGKGYVTEATRAIIEWAFQQPAIYRVYATTDVDNVASRRVLEKVGMQCEGILHKYILHPNISDIPRDSYMYAITK